MTDTTAYYRKRFGIHAGRCTACPAPVFWLLHHITGKRAPIDVVASSTGNVRIIGRTHTYEITTAPTTPDDPHRHTSHFVTCPQAQRFRRARNDPGESHD